MHWQIAECELCENTRHPILPPKMHRYTDLIIEKFHKTALHTGVSQTLGLMRQKYWIPQGRFAVRKVLLSCTTCQQHKGGPYIMPLMPPLPAERLSESPSFTSQESTILDLYISNQRKIDKRYGLVDIPV